MIFYYCVPKMEDYYNYSMLKFLIVICIGFLCQAHFVTSGPLPSGHTHQYPLLKQSNLNYVHSIIAPSNSQKKCGCNHCAAGHEHQQQKVSPRDNIKIRDHDSKIIQTNDGQGCQCGHSHSAPAIEKQVCEKCSNGACTCDKCDCDDKKQNDGSKCSSCKCSKHKQDRKSAGCTCSKHQNKGSKNLGQQGDSKAKAPFLALNPLQSILTAGNMKYH